MIAQRRSNGLVVSLSLLVAASFAQRALQSSTDQAHSVYAQAISCVSVLMKLGSLSSLTFCSEKTTILQED